MRQTKRKTKSYRLSSGNKFHWFLSKLCAATWANHKKNRDELSPKWKTRATKFFQHDRCQVICWVNSKRMCELYVGLFICLSNVFWASSFTRTLYFLKFPALQNKYYYFNKANHDFTELSIRNNLIFFRSFFFLHFSRSLSFRLLLLLLNRILLGDVLIFIERYHFDT